MTVCLWINGSPNVTYISQSNQTIKNNQCGRYEEYIDVGVMASADREVYREC
jgi:hypothetical protein